MEGITSKETQLRVLSIVDSPKEEKERMQRETDEAQEQAIEKIASAGADTQEGIDDAE